MAEPTMSDLANLIRNLDTYLNAKIDGVQKQMNAKIEGVQQQVTGVQARVDGLHSASASASSGPVPGPGAHAG
jgi:hypothetical protein